MEEKNTSLPIIHSEDDIKENMHEEINNGKGEDEDE